MSSQDNFKALTFEEVSSLVIDWAHKKGLDTPATMFQQLAKTMEELGELSSAISKKKHVELVDALGDVTVCLIIIAHQNGVRLDRCLEHAWDVIKDRKGETVNGTFIKEEDNINFRGYIHKS